MSKTLSASEEVGPCGLWVFQGLALAAAVDRLKVERRVLPSPSDKHVARPARIRQQPQRAASQGHPTEHRTSALHTCKCTQAFTFFHHRQAWIRSVVYQMQSTRPQRTRTIKMATHEIMLFRTCAALLHFAFLGLRGVRRG